ncbi:MAG: hypothetical protein WKG52_05980 [Variovorax sp.]
MSFPLSATGDIGRCCSLLGAVMRLVDDEMVTPPNAVATVTRAHAHAMR